MGHENRPDVDLCIGLMSGTSLDGVDGVLAQITDTSTSVLHHASRCMPPELKTRLLQLNTPGHNELHLAALAANQLATVYADVVQSLLGACGLAGKHILAIGAHGQTVRHQPSLHDGRGYTVQLNHPALLAELTDIDVVADFRSRDLFAGGQGAPLVPAFHQQMFGHPHEAVAVLNLGGIANLSLLPPTLTAQAVRGFDCGPANALMDHWCEHHTGQAFDVDGAWAAGGTVHPGLLAHLLDEAYFQAPLPKSTGRDLFNAQWLAHKLLPWPEAAPQDVQASLLELTAHLCVNDLRQHAPDSATLLVCGGGAFNRALMQRLRELASQYLPQLKVWVTDEFGLPAQQVEASAFAWLARQAVLRRHGNLPSVTGARGGRVLGAIYPR